MMVSVVIVTVIILETFCYIRNCNLFQEIIFLQQTQKISDSMWVIGLLIVLVSFYSTILVPTTTIAGKHHLGYANTI